ncbi:transglutaminase-like domain-containing protein [Candidatus Omnitrophota bacterium]
MTKKIIICILFVVVLINISVAFFLLKNRSFSHLAIWNIIESREKGDFYWEPEEAPQYFYFEPDTDKLTIFRDEIALIVEDEQTEFTIALAIAKHLMDISPQGDYSGMRLRWDSPESMLRQIKDGARGHCFHRAILLSSYLASLGIKSRLWALENEGFDGVAHSINEIYVKDLGKWVFIDATHGFYAMSKESDLPLSFLELREMLLKSPSDKVRMHNIREDVEPLEIAPFYRRLVKCAFLRANNDFVNKYEVRYGYFSSCNRYLDKLPASIRRGLDYLLGGRDVFIHYVDGFSKSLRQKMIIVKAFFYFFIFSLGCLGLFSAMFFLKKYLTINRSRNATRHK